VFEAGSGAMSDSCACFDHCRHVVHPVLARNRSHGIYVCMCTHMLHALQAAFDEAVQDSIDALGLEVRHIQLDTKVKLRTAHDGLISSCMP
jgi:hypothetical protein